MPRARGRGVLLALVVGIAATAGFLIWQSGALLSATQTVSERASIGGPFRLASSKGGDLSDGDLKGKPFAIFFGFTRCPEVCPTTLWDMSESLHRLGAQAQDLTVVFVSLDPERDTPQTLASYIQSFDPRIIGLSGPPAQIAALAKAYRVFWRKVPTSDGDYTLDHTAVVYLMDRQGHYAGIIGYKEDEAARDEKLRQLLAMPGAAG